MKSYKKIFTRFLDIIKDRYLIMYIVVIVISVIFIATLFNLQIVNGENYREQSEKECLEPKYYCTTWRNI